MTKVSVPKNIVDKIARGPADFEVQTFRAGGNGGQNQNTRDTGVRIIDRQTGVRAESREHRTQLANRKAAFRKLVDRLIAYYVEEQASGQPPTEEMLVVRSYKFPRGYAIDHRTATKYPLKDVMDGDLDPIHKDLRG